MEDPKQVKKKKSSAVLFPHESASDVGCLFSSILDPSRPMDVMSPFPLCCSCCFNRQVFVNSATEFYILRFLLGAAEAGTFPGINFTLSLFYK